MSIIELAPSPHMRKGERERSTLIQATFSLIAEAGLQHLTIAAICQRIGLQRSSFYTHFKDLDELLDDLTNQLLDAIGEHSQTEFDNQTDIDFLLHFRMHFLARLVSSQPDIGQVLHDLYTFHSPASAKLKARISGDLVLANENGHLQLDQQEVDALAHIIVPSMIDWFKRLSDSNQREPESDNVIRLLLRAAGYKLPQ